MRKLLRNLNFLKITFATIFLGTVMLSPTFCSNVLAKYSYDFEIPLVVRDILRFYLTVYTYLHI